MARIAAVLTSIAVAASAMAEDGAPLRNWFNDPFLQVRAEFPGCPVPRGPLLTETERKAEAHSRVERGTSCWMAGTCARPNAYLYDASIGESIADRFAASAEFRGASLWVTVKRRFAWVEGCVADAAQAKLLEAFLLPVPDLERVILDVMTGTRQKPPYAVLKDTQPPQ